VPFIGLQTGTRAIDTIVHEHYDGASIAQAKSLERMYFGKGIGRYRWEYWAPGRTPLRRLVCPALDYSVPPAPGWVQLERDLAAGGGRRRFGREILSLIARLRAPPAPA
jgi:hypothetical protein